jgi:sugar phosphate permease
MAAAVARGRYRWTILAIGVVAQASFSAVFFGIPVLAPALREDYDLTLSQLGIVIASVSVGMLLTVFPWGIVADRIGERLVMGIGLTLGGAALALAATATSFTSLVVALTAAGAFGACVQAASGRAVMRWFDASQRGFALGIRQTAVVVGGAAAALGLPALAASGGSRAGLAGLAAAALVAALASALGLREAPGGAERVVGSTRATLRDRRLWRLCGGSALLVVAQVAILSFAVLFLHDERGLSTGAAAAVLALMQVLGGALRIASGHWSDRMGLRLAPLLRLGYALAITLAASAALVEAPLELLLPVFVVAGSLSSGWNGLSFAAAAELAGEAAAGAALGLQQASLSLAAAVTPIVFVTIVERVSWGAGFAFGATVALVGTVSLVALSAREAEAAAAGAYDEAAPSSTSG